jgi:hypothetical protein
LSIPFFVLNPFRLELAIHPFFAMLKVKRATVKSKLLFVNTSKFTNLDKKNITMKKILLSVIAITALTLQSNAQVSARVVSPALIAGNMEFDYATPDDGWDAILDLDVAGNFVQDTLAFVEDGSPGLNDQGNPISQEGCGALINPNDLVGKIAILYRNTCEFGTKAKNAEDAGAVGVIIINREDAIFGMLPGDDGAGVTIPVVIIWASQGATIKDEMGNGAVVAFLGNKTGANPNDVATSEGVAYTPKAGLTTLFSDSITPRVEFYNYGSASQDSVYINVAINNGASDVYSEEKGPFAMAPNDTLLIDDFSPQAFPAYVYSIIGDYTLTYTLSIANNDDDDLLDNEVVHPFTVTSGSIGGGRLTATNEPIATGGNLITSGETALNECVSFNASNASASAMSGIKYIPYTDTALYDLAGVEVQVALYEWEPSFDGDDNFNLTTSTEVARSGIFLSGNAQHMKVVEVPLVGGWALENDDVYLACIETFNPAEVGFGYDNEVNLAGNTQYVRRPACPVFADAWYNSTFGSPAGMAVQFVDPINVGVSENVALAANVFPNPATDKVSIRLNAQGSANIIVADITGKIVINTTVELVNGKTTINTNSLESGMYIFNITLANGQSTKVNVVKK